jgi:hypothetical protein
VSIFMEDRTDHHLNGRGIVPEHKNLFGDGVIHSISRCILLPKGPNTKVHTIPFGPKVFLTPINGLLNNTTNLLCGHIRGGGL